MSPHPLLIKRFFRFQMITVVTLVILGALYLLGLWIKNDLLLNVLDPMISILATLGFYGLFLAPLTWIIGRFVFVRVVSRKRMPPELKERLRGLAAETLRRMNVDRKLSFVIGRRSSSAYVYRAFGRTRIVIGENLVQGASDEEVMAILGHEVGHVVKGHLHIKGLTTLVSVIAFVVLFGTNGESRSAIILGITVLLSLVIAGMPLNWRLEYTADRFSAERLGASPMVSALEKLKITNPDCVSFTHPPLSRRIRRIGELSITPLITHVYA